MYRPEFVKQDHLHLLDLVALVLAAAQGQHFLDTGLAHLLLILWANINHQRISGNFKCESLKCWSYYVLSHQLLSFVFVLDELLVKYSFYRIFHSTIVFYAPDLV